MNSVAFLSISFLSLISVKADTTDTNPLSKTVEMLETLLAKVRAEGDAEAKAYKDYEDWCDDTASNVKYDIKTGETRKEELEASITKSTADIQASDDKIEDLASSIANDDKELKEATSVRKSEAANFAASEAELVDAIDTLDRAIMILQRDMKKNPAALAQIESSNTEKLLKTLSTVIDAAAFPATDQKKLAALVQSQQSSDSDDDDQGAPAAAAYKSHSTNIFDMLEDLKEKAEGQLSDLRKAESSTKHNFLMLKQSLADQISADTKDADEEKSAKASSEEAKSVAEGDLAETAKSLQNDKAALATASSTCMTAAADHEASLKSRGEEMTALSSAIKILKDTSSGAVAQSYTFFQLLHQHTSRSMLQTRMDLANAEVISLLKKLAKENNSPALAQLASRIAATLRYGAAAGEDPFAKVKSLIEDMLMKLEAEATSELTEHSYCQEELAKTEEKKAALDAEITKLSTKMDQAASASARLKADVKEIQAELASLMRSQAEMDVIRRESHKEYLQAKEDLTLGLEGVRKAVSVLHQYYGGADASAAMLQGSSDFAAMMEQPAAPEKHSKAGGAGSSIISMLEVVESDFAKDLATEETAEADAEAEYQKTTQMNANTKTIKEQDVKYKTKEYKALDKHLSELSGDKNTAGAEQDAVMEYFAKIRERCVAKPEAYETRKARRESEIQGLKEALTIIEGETMFAQRSKKRGLRPSFLAAM